MTPSTSAPKLGVDPHSNGETQQNKKGRTSSRPQDDSNSTLPGSKDPPNNPLKDNDNQQEHRSLHQLYATDEFARALSFEVATCFTALMTKARFQEEDVYYISDKEDGKGKEEKTGTTLSALGPIPRQIDVMVNFFLYKVDNGVTGVLGLSIRKQLSKQSKDYYDMNNKWVKLESLFWNVNGETGVGGTIQRLFGCNVVNYGTIKKYMIMYREMLVWYMDNVQYPPAPDNMSKDLWLYTKCCQNCSPHDSKH
eukprot:jgi/Psemu1/37319/gm1.37319_g